MREVSRDPINTGMNKRGWRALLISIEDTSGCINLQVGNHKLPELDTLNRLYVSLSDHRMKLTYCKEPIPNSPRNWRVPYHDDQWQTLVFHDVPKRIPLGAHLDLRKECLTISNFRAIEYTTRLTLTEKKAIAAPNIEANEAIKNPGQMPYVKPISDMDPAKPKSGGCDAKTTYQRPMVTNGKGI